MLKEMVITDKFYTIQSDIVKNQKRPWTASPAYTDVRSCVLVSLVAPVHSYLQTVLNQIISFFKLLYFLLLYFLKFPVNFFTFALYSYSYPC